jgi:hypothetical protein
MHINSFCTNLFKTNFTEVISHAVAHVQKTERARVLQNTKITDYMELAWISG